MLRRLPLLAICLVLGAACAELKTAPPGEPAADGGGSNTDGAAATIDGSARDGAAADGGPDSSADGGEITGNRGPGAHGSLPSGYCCTDNTQCRERHCVDGMCLDVCRKSQNCTRPEMAFTCDAVGSNDGLCRPSPGANCIPQANFERGAKPAGACCSVTGDGTAGAECDGNLCVAIGSGPYVCTHACSGGTDCPNSFTCLDVGDEGKQCIPANATYTCQ